MSENSEDRTASNLCRLATDARRRVLDYNDMVENLRQFKKLKWYLDDAILAHEEAIDKYKQDGHT